MSSRTLDKCWYDVQLELDNIIEREILGSDVKCVKTFQLLAFYYVKYVVILRKLEECYDRMIHPQKRALIKKLMEGVMGRIIEIKHEMVAIEFCDGFNWNDILKELSLTPDDIVIPIPNYFRQERLEEFSSRISLIDEIRARFGLLEEKVKPFVSTTEEAILLIQRMERARQGWQRTQLMYDSYLRKNREKLLQVPTSQAISTYTDPHSSAIKIQRVWKGFSTWQKIQKEREEEMEFLGMKYSKLKANENESHFDQVYEERCRNHQKFGQQECQSSFTQLKEQIYHDQGDSIKENMENEIRNWFFTYKEISGRFPDYPSDEEGGYKSNLLTNVNQLILNAQEEEKIRLHNEKMASQYDKKKQNLQSKVKMTKKNAEGETPTTQKQSSYLPILTEGCNTFKGVWETKLSQSFKVLGVCEEIYDEALIFESAKAEVQSELKKQVDILMRQELQFLKLAYFKDQGKSGRKLKAAMRSKQPKGKVGKRKRKEKDVIPGRSNESLIEELVRENIIKKCPKAYLNDYVGEDNLGPTVVDDMCPTLFPSDVRRVLTEYCIIPLGCPAVHSKCQIVKSVLFVGPVKSGKTMLVHAVCTELGATFIDLSAGNLVGKYTTREDLRIMFNMVSKAARLMQPTIILVEDADLMFVKSLAKIDKTDPKRIKTGLQKLIKGIMAEDAVLVIGTSCHPFECDMKGLASTYNKIILLPRPDHSSRNTLWKRKIRELGGNDLSAVDFGNLVKISDGYSSGSIVNCVKQVLSSYRVALQKKKPLKLEEFVFALSKVEPVYKEEEEAFKSFSYRTPLAKKRAAALEPEESKRAREKLLIKKRKQMELEKRFHDADNKGKNKSKPKKRK